MLNYIETHIVDHCNLRCAGCSHFSGLASPYFKDLNTFDDEFAKLAELTNHNIPMIRIMGGEPLLHPQVVDFCVCARHHFPKSAIALVSNGTLLKFMSDQDIDTLNNIRVELCVSDYGISIDRNQFNKFNKRYFHPKSKMYNICLDLDGEQDKNISFFNCDLVQGQWYFFKDYRIYQCCIMANIDIFCRHFNEQETIVYSLDDISIDIRHHTLEDVEKFLHQPHDVCRFCDTRKRHQSYHEFAVSKKDITEWIK